MIARWRLWKPDVSGVASEPPSLERADNGVALTDLAASRVHEVGPTLHFREQCIAEQTFRLGMQRRIDRDYVAHLDERFRIRVKRDI